MDNYKYPSGPRYPCPPSSMYENQGPYRAEAPPAPFQQYSYPPTRPPPAYPPPQPYNYAYPSAYAFPPPTAQPQGYNCSLTVSAPTAAPGPSGYDYFGYPNPNPNLNPNPNAYFDHTQPQPSGSYNTAPYNHSTFPMANHGHSAPSQFGLTGHSSQKSSAYTVEACRKDDDLRARHRSSVGRQHYSREPRYFRPRSRERSSRSYSKRYSRSRSRSRSPYRRRRSRSRTRRRSRSRSRERDYVRRCQVKDRCRDVRSYGRDKPSSERDALLARWRKNYCATSEEMSSKLEELSKLDEDDVIRQEKEVWTRTTPAEVFYKRQLIKPPPEEQYLVRGTSKLEQVCARFYEDLVLRAEKVNALKPKYEPPQRKKKIRLCLHKSEKCGSSDASSSDDNLSEEEQEDIMEELTRKQQHPDRLHPEMWYNDPGEMNDGPVCRCSLKSRKSGIRHGIYAGERFIEMCDKNSNNADKLYHYRITISPPTNFLTKTPTIIKHDEHEFIFEGFSMFSHFPLKKLPTCKVIRFNIEYTILYIEEAHPDNFTIKELDLFHDYLFRELLELVDLDFRAAGDKDGCCQFHFMPRFVRDIAHNGREILSMSEVLQYLLDSSKLLIDGSELETMVQMSQYEWQALADEVKGMIVTYPGKKPCSVRVDQLDRNCDLQEAGKPRFPEIVHFGIRPPQLSYAGNPEYQKAWRDYVKFRHLLANMSKPTFEDKRKLEAKENKLQEMRTQSKMKRDVTVAVSAEGFRRTGIMCDVVQHAMLIPVLVCHLRFHHSLNVLEEGIGYRFQNRALLQLALTHPSYRENFGTNPDHARNSLTNCGIRQPEYGDRRIHYMNTRKRGINTLINIMSRFGKTHETESNITHNERLEFLGDAVVEFLSSIHLFRMFPELEEGGLATYRAAIVQNQHLAVLARALDLDQFMLYAHGSDLCHDLELRHAMANCFEALMGALFLDGGIAVADRVFGCTLFKDNSLLLTVWQNMPPHPLQEQEPNGDRQWIPNFEVLQRLTQFETDTGIHFKHIRLLARAFTDRSIGYTNLTLGSNQRLEFLGDTVLQLIASEYLYKFFPEHHEGHLSLLRSSLVNNRTQAVVCDDLGMAAYAVYNNPKAELKTKDRADLLEAFVGALYIDKDIEFCRVFCNVTLFPRLQDFIMNQDWNDPKSKLQQCCLTLRTMDGGEPDIPVYKVIECKGPTNTRVYTVAVYFRGRRLAKATGHSIQQAEMNSAKRALEISQDLFPQLDHQKRVIAKSMKKQKYPREPKNSNSGSEAETEGNEKSSKFSRRLKTRDSTSREHSRSRERSKKSRSKSLSRSDHKNSSRSRSNSNSRSKSPSPATNSRTLPSQFRSRSSSLEILDTTSLPSQSKSELTRSKSIEFLNFEASSSKPTRSICSSKPSHSKSPLTSSSEKSSTNCYGRNPYASGSKYTKTVSSSKNKLPDKYKSSLTSRAERPRSRSRSKSLELFNPYASTSKYIPPRQAKSSQTFKYTPSRSKSIELMDTYCSYQNTDSNSSKMNISERSMCHQESKKT